MSESTKVRIIFFVIIVTTFIIGYVSGIATIKGEVEPEPKRVIVCTTWQDGSEPYCREVEIKKP